MATKMQLSKTAREVQTEDLELLEQNLRIIREQSEKVKEYIKTHDWAKAEAKDRAGEFALQADMTNKIVMWTEAYIKGSGILNVFERSIVKENKLRTNFSYSGVEELMNKYNEEESEEEGDNGE